MSQLEQYIRSGFGDLSPEESAVIRAGFKAQQLKRGDFLLEAGKRCDQLCFVQSGLLRMFFLADGKEITQWISSQGYFATDLSSFLYGAPSKLNIQALSDTEIFVINKADYEALGRKLPRWHELEKSFVLRCFIVLEDRISQHLALSAEERYQLFFENNKALFQQVPLQYLASMLGMTPETFSRIRKKLL